MKVGLFGGSFDPIHIGHLIIANFALNEFALDKVIFIPASTSPFKNDYLFTPIDRLEMVKIAIRDNDKFEVSDFEVKNGGISYTIRTVEYFKKVYRIFLIVGQDSAESLHCWKESFEILRNVEVLVYRRIIDGIVKDFKVPEVLVEYANKFHIINSPYIDVSSTLVRKLLNSGKSVRYLVPDGVLEYIKRIGINVVF
jgi:nicotinate-nucleotide adenylyltransferase